MDSNYLSFGTLLKSAKVILSSALSLLATSLLTSSSGVEAEDFVDPTELPPITGTDSFLAVTAPLPNMTITAGQIESLIIPSHWSIDPSSWIRDLQIQYPNGSIGPDWLSLTPPPNWMKRENLFTSMGSGLFVPHTLSSPLQVASPVNETFYMLFNDGTTHAYSLLTWPANNPTKTAIYPFEHTPIYWTINTNKLITMATETQQLGGELVLMTLDARNVSDITPVGQVTLALEGVNPLALQIKDMIIDQHSEAAYVLLGDFTETLLGVQAYDISNPYNITQTANYTLVTQNPHSVAEASLSLSDQGLTVLYIITKHTQISERSLLYYYPIDSNGNLTSQVLLVNTSRRVNTSSSELVFRASLDAHYFANDTLLTFESFITDTGINDPQTATSYLTTYNLSDGSEINSLQLPNVLPNEIARIDEYLFVSQLSLTPSLYTNNTILNISLPSAPSVIKQFEVRGSPRFIFTRKHKTPFIKYYWSKYLSEDPADFPQWDRVQFLNISDPTHPIPGITILGQTPNIAYQNNLITITVQENGLYSLHLYMRVNGQWTFSHKAPQTFLKYAGNYQNYLYFQDQFSVGVIHYGIEGWLIISTVYKQASGEVPLKMLASFTNSKAVYYPMTLTIESPATLNHELTAQSLTYGESWSYRFPNHFLSYPSDRILLIKPSKQTALDFSWLSLKYQPIIEEVAQINNYPSPSADLVYYDDGLAVAIGSFLAPSAIRMGFYNINIDNSTISHLVDFTYQKSGAPYGITRASDLLYPFFYIEEDPSTIYLSLLAMNISDPHSPSLLGSYQYHSLYLHEYQTAPIIIKNDLAILIMPICYVQCYGTINFLNLTEPSNITSIAQTSIQGKIIDSHLYQDYYLIALDLNGHFEVLNISEIIAPISMSLIEVHDDTLFSKGAINENRLFITCGPYNGINTQKVAYYLYDITSPANPILVTKQLQPEFIESMGMLLVNDFAFTIMQDRFHQMFLGALIITDTNATDWAYISLLDHNACPFNFISSLTLHHNKLLMVGLTPSAQFTDFQFCTIEVDYQTMTLTTDVVPLSSHVKYELQFEARDQVSGNFTIPLTIGINNHPPIVSQPIGNRSVNIGHQVDIEIANVFFDQDGDSLEYSAKLSKGDKLPNWLTFSSTLQKFFGQPHENSPQMTYLIDVMAIDGYGGNVTAPFYFVVNIPPTSQPIPGQVMLTGSNNNYTIPHNTFSSHDPLTYTAALDGGLPFPSGLSFDPQTRRVVVTDTVEADIYDIRITANDPYGGHASETLTLTLDNPPTVTTDELETTVYINSGQLNYKLPPSVFQASSRQLLKLNATCIEGLSKTCPITWLFFNPNTARFSGEPPHASQGKYYIKVEATDPVVEAHFPQNGTVSTTLIIDVPNRPPVIEETIPTLQAFIWEAFDYAVPVSLFKDPDGDDLTFIILKSGGAPLPDWLTFDPHNHQLSGEPSLIPWQGDDLNLMIRASDGRADVSSEFQVQVSTSVVVKKLIQYYGLSGVGFAAIWMIVRWLRLQQLQLRKTSLNDSHILHHKTPLAANAFNNPLSANHNKQGDDMSWIKDAYQRLSDTIIHHETDALENHVTSLIDTIKSHANSDEALFVTELPNLLTLASQAIEVVQAMNVGTSIVHRVMPWLSAAKSLIDFVLINNSAVSGWVLLDYKLEITNRLEDIKVRSERRHDVSIEALHHIELIMEAARCLIDDHSMSYVGKGRSAFLGQVAGMIAAVPYGTYSVLTEYANTPTPWYPHLLEVEASLLSDSVTITEIKDAQRLLIEYDDWRFVYAIITLFEQVALQHDDEPLLLQIMQGSHEIGDTQLKGLHALIDFDRHLLSGLSFCGLTDYNFIIKTRAREAIEKINENHGDLFSSWHSISHYSVDREDDNMARHDELDALGYNRL